jgi:hypothetical protein
MEGRRATISSSGELIDECYCLSLNPASIRAIGKVHSDIRLLAIHPSIHPSINQSINRPTK